MPGPWGFASALRCRCGGGGAPYLVFSSLCAAARALVRGGGLLASRTSNQPTPDEHVFPCQERVVLYFQTQYIYSAKKGNNIEKFRLSYHPFPVQL